MAIADSPIKVVDAQDAVNKRHAHTNKSVLDSLSASGNSLKLNGVDVSGTGLPGSAASVEIGTTTTGNAGSQAAVTNRGSSSNAILDFVIPRGADGTSGAAGKNGAPGSVGPSGGPIPSGGLPGQFPTLKEGGGYEWRDAYRYGDPYPGVDLTTRHAAEIAAAPFSGNPWSWIKARIQAANFAGIHVGDYIPFTAGGNAIKAEVAGIDTYYNFGDTAVPHHIDFISRDCWPDLHVYNKVNYNNGTSVSPYPWLASDLYAYLNSLSMNVPNAATANPAPVAVNYTATGVYDKLPATLKSVIIPKRALLPQRYTAGSLLVNDNTYGWADAGKLWVPSEVEVYGMEHWGSKNGYSGAGFQQYPVFAHNMRRIKGASDGGTRTNWWLLSACGGYSTYCAIVYSNGIAYSTSATDTSVRVPVCFRIA